LRRKIIVSILDDLFPNPPISLDHKDPFTLLIATLLSAQCTDERVNKLTPALFERADTAQKMGELTLEELEHLVKSAGLYKNKAKAIKEISNILIAKYKGKVPRTSKALEELPGVGHKTASVVLSQAFNKPAVAVDTHVHRCMTRWGVTNGKNVEQTEKDIKALFPKSRWNKLHLQVIYYARAYCPARGHHIDACPICKALFTEAKQ
jgi:endonuclease III